MRSPDERSSVGEWLDLSFWAWSRSIVKKKPEKKKESPKTLLLRQMLAPTDQLRTGWPRIAAYLG
jgi:hypothetical protein